MAGELTFEKVWEEFQNKVRPYNARQKKQILHLVSTSFQEILAQMPAPRREEAEGEQPQISSPSSKRMLADVEAFLYDRFIALGEDKSLFLRFDTKATGRVSQQQFKACMAALGIAITDGEMEALVKKYDSENTGNVNYHDFWKFLQASAEAPRSTTQSQFSAALLNRPPQTGAAYASLVRDIPRSVEDRLSEGLRRMRESMYQKSSNFHGTFTSLQNNQKLVPVAEFVPQLYKLGFPEGLASEEELMTAAMKHSLRHEGFFTYAELLHFLTGQDPTPPQEAESGAALDSPALMNALIKVNNINLRKFFKELDSDNDGLITTEELGRGLVESGGLHPAMARDQSFKKYAEGFAKRKPGHFGYAEFIQFLNTRVAGNTGPISGQPLTGGHAPVVLPADANPSQLLESIVKHMRGSAVSVESVFEQFDHDLDGKLDEAEFFLAVSALGFQLSAEQSKIFFDAVDSDNSGSVSIPEFAALIVNPQRNPKLSTRVRHAPGGASSVPMGSYSSNKPEAVSRPSTARGQPRASTFDLSTTQTPLSPEEQAAALKSQRTSIHFTNQNASKVDLSFHEGAPPAPQSASPEAAATGAEAGASSPSPTPTPSPSSARVRNPPGGRSTIDFVNDHGAVRPQTASGNQANRESQPQLLHFDPSAPVQPVARPRTTPTGGEDHVELRDDLPALTTPQRSMVRPLHSPGGESRVSFNQNDREDVRAVRRVLASPGGNSSIQLGFEAAALSPEAVQPSYRSQDELHIDLKFDPTTATPEATRRARRAVDGSPPSTVQLAHSSSRQDEDLAAPHGMSHRTRKHVEGPPMGVALGSDAGKEVLASYREAPQEVDVSLVQQLSKAVYAHSQRVRHTFQEWNHNSNASTLSKQNFVEGARKLHVPMSDEQADALFARFDGDADGEITYSEFIRLLSIK